MVMPGVGMSVLRQKPMSRRRRLKTRLEGGRCEARRVSVGALECSNAVLMVMKTTLMPTVRFSASE